jgi:uncharacterized protein YoxC
MKIAIITLALALGWACVYAVQQRHRADQTAKVLEATIAACADDWLAKPLTDAERNVGGN